MNHKVLLALSGLILACLAACSTVPVTGRQQLDIVPSGQILAMSSEQYDKFLSEHKVVSGTSEARMVQRVGRNIQSAVERYLADAGRRDLLAGYHWEFNLVQDDSINAWAMPGGKVVVYTGILPVTRDETGLAVVMGHEVAHAVAKHGNERMSQALLTQLGGVALSVALSQNPSVTNDLFLAAYGMGTQVGILLPYSRLQESEADRLGLIFMAMAGYDPRQADDFWERMAAKKQGEAPPEFLSTHPSDRRRIEDIRELIPEAMKYYRKN
jgi:predicted Zn-dependent protease